jgi:hypothetical protein
MSQITGLKRKQVRNDNDTTADNNNNNNDIKASLIKDRYTFCGIYQPLSLKDDGQGNDYCVACPFTLSVYITWLDDKEKTRGTIVGDIRWHYGLHWLHEDSLTQKKTIYSVASQTKRVQGSVYYTKEKGMRNRSEQVEFIFRTSRFNVIDASISEFSDLDITDNNEEIKSDQILNTFEEFEAERSYKIIMIEGDENILMNTTTMSADNHDNNNSNNNTEESTVCSFLHVIDDNSIDQLSNENRFVQSIYDIKQTIINGIIERINSIFQNEERQLMNQRLVQLSSRIENLILNPIEMERRIIPLRKGDKCVPEQIKLALLAIGFHFIDNDSIALSPEYDIIFLVFLYRALIKQIVS